MSDHERETETTAEPPHEDPPADAIAAIYGPSTPLPPSEARKGRRARRAERKAAAADGDGNGNGNGHPALVALDGGGEGGEPPEPLPRPKIKWLRLTFLIGGLGVLAAVSTVFGMMMAVASDLPEIDVLDFATRQSRIVDRD